MLIARPVTTRQDPAILEKRDKTSEGDGFRVVEVGMNIFGIWLDDERSICLLAIQSHGDKRFCTGWRIMNRLLGLGLGLSLGFRLIRIVFNLG